MCFYDFAHCIYCENVEDRGLWKCDQQLRGFCREMETVPLAWGLTQWWHHRRRIKLVRCSECKEKGHKLWRNGFKGPLYTYPDTYFFMKNKYKYEGVAPIEDNYDDDYDGDEDENKDENKVSKAISAATTSESASK